MFMTYPESKKQDKFGTKSKHSIIKQIIFLVENKFPSLNVIALSDVFIRRWHQFWEHHVKSERSYEQHRQHEAKQNI